MCAPKKKAVKTRTAKKVSVNGKAVRAAGPTTTVRPEPRAGTQLSFENLQARNPAYQAQQRSKAKRKKKAKQAALRDQTTTTTTTTTTGGEDDITTNTSGDDNTTTTIIGGGVGDTSVTPESIYTQDPEEAMEAQELLAQDELRRQRIKRARAKQSLLRRRIERDREVGSGRRVLSGTERELNVQTRQAGTGRRGGTGRRSLITGSTGGIGYYSRFL